MVNPEMEAGPTTTKSRNEQNERRIYITKNMVSEFGTALGCKGCFEIGQPHTEECRTRITAEIEQDPSHAWRLGETTTKRLEMVRQAPDDVLAEESRQDAAVKPREPDITGGSPINTIAKDVEVRPTASCKRPLEPGGDDDMVRRGNAYVDDCDGDFEDEMTAATRSRDDGAKARAEEMAWYDRCEACEEVIDETCLSRTGRKPISCRWKGINSERVEVRNRLIAREIKQKGPTATSREHHRWGFDENEIRETTATHGTRGRKSIPAR